ncbi:MAG: tetratricopeptide repeat protein [Deltaproteobacteria bacterium]|nr:tetratricopeptide repeat protein [Deltaproteobacteria bacterium]
MKKNRCALCSSNKARRKCAKHGDTLICPQCCSESRDTVCSGCHYYKKARQYQSSKISKPKNRHFIAEINEEVEKSVDDALALVERGNILEAEHKLESLRTSYPTNHMVNYGIGVVHAFRGDNDKAIDYFTRATSVFPYLIEAHFNKAVAYKNKLDIKNAIKSFAEVIELGDPQNDMVRQASEFVAGFEEQVFKTHNVTLDRFFESQSEFETGFSFMEDGKWEKAIDRFKRAVRLNRAHPQSYGNMGLCYAQLGRKKDALDAFDKAIGLDPNYEPAIVNRAFVERLEEGEPLNQERFESVNYYKDYPFKKKSFIQETLNRIFK